MGRPAILRSNHVPLVAGSRLGAYEFISLLRARGIVEVYRVTDLVFTGNALRSRR